MPQSIADESAYIRDLIERVVDECPRRQPTSEDERRAATIVQDAFARLGLESWSEGFEFNDNLYANIALHFGLGSLGTAISGVAPHLALPLHLLAGLSYRLDSTRRAYLLRRMLGFKPSQNVLAVLPAEGEPKLRIVLNAHLDAAFTGLVFNPRVVDALSGDERANPLPFLDRPLALATNTQFALAGFDLLRMVFGPLTWPLRPLEWLLGTPGLVAFLATAEVCLRNQIVPGANDDLTGVAALPVLALRLAAVKPPEVELVFAATGCEEASMGGADALVKAKRDQWPPQNTVGLSLEMLGNGELVFLQGEGEVVQTPTPAWLIEAVHKVVASEPRFAGVKGFEPPVGGSDAAAFLANGYDAICLCCLDRRLGTAAHYHLPDDTLEHVDLDKVMHAVDFAEKLVHTIIEMRLGLTPARPARSSPARPRSRAPGRSRAKKKKTPA